MFVFTAIKVGDHVRVKYVNEDRTVTTEHALVEKLLICRVDATWSLWFVPYWYETKGDVDESTGLDIVLEWKPDQARVLEGPLPVDAIDQRVWVSYLL